VALKIPSAVSRRLKDIGALAGGLPVYAVGGVVRDWLLGRDTQDLDLVVDGDPAPLARALARKLKGKAEAFDAFGTWRILSKGGGRIDVARSRKEVYPAPAVLPVVEPAPLRDDLYRRDFTVNAMAVSIVPDGFGKLEDPWGGAEDLGARVLRVLHPASFRDDPTRIFRAARFASRLGFALDPATAGWLSGAVAQGDLFLLSRERVRQELLRILAEPDPLGPLERLRDWGAHSAFYHGFSWDGSLRKSADPKVRLGLLALHLEQSRSSSGAGFLDSLHLERADGRALKAAVECAARKASPRAKLAKLADEVLAAAGVPPKARAAVLLGGADLKRAGLKPGKEMGALLEQAAREQWAGRFPTKAAALQWLKRRIASTS